MTTPGDALGLALDALQENVVPYLTLGSNRIGNAGAAKLARALEGNCTLRHLDLSFSDIGPDGAIELAKVLQGNSKLAQLDLRGNGIGDEGAAALTQALIHNRTLTQLDLRNNFLGLAGATDWARALRPGSPLTQVDLSGNRIKDDSADEVAKALMENTTLTQLNLADNFIGHAGAASLAKALNGNTTLTWLDLSYNRIQDEGAVALAKGLQGNRRLRYLDVRANDIGQAGATDMGKLLANNKRLTRLVHTEASPVACLVLSESSETSGDEAYAGPIVLRAKVELRPKVRQLEAKLELASTDKAGSEGKLQRASHTAEVLASKLAALKQSRKKGSLRAQGLVSNLNELEDRLSSSSQFTPTDLEQKLESAYRDKATSDMKLLVASRKAVALEAALRELLQQQFLQAEAVPEDEKEPDAEGMWVDLWLDQTSAQMQTLKQLQQVERWARAKWGHFVSTVTKPTFVFSTGIVALSITSKMLLRRYGPPLPQ